MSVELIRRGQSQIYGQVGVGLRGQTWINLADAGDTSPQTVSNLDITKTYLLINDAGANVTIDTVDTPTPVKLTGETSFDFVWSSGKIALYELSAEETALDASVLGQKYHYVSDTKSTNSVRVKSVGKNLWNYDALQHPANIVSNGWGLKLSNKYFTIDQRYTISVDNLTWLKISTYPSGTSPAQGTNITKLEFTYTSALDGLFLMVNRTDFSIITDIEELKQLNIQLEKGTIATPYEPYKESSAIINLSEPLRSLPNGVKDEVNVVSGVKTQMIKQIILNGSEDWFAHRETDNYISFYMNKTSDMIKTSDVNTISANIPFEVWRDPLKDKHYLWLAPGSFGISVNKEWLSTQNATGFKAWLQANPVTLNYRLATPITTYIDPQPLQIFPSGNRWVEHANKEVAIYNTGIHVTNTDLPIKEMIKVDKIGLQNGRWYREPVDLADVTVAPDGLSFTIDGATSGPYEQYEFEYYYDSALSTLPELVIPDEPSLVTIKNKNISL